MAGSPKGDHSTNYVIGSLFPRVPGTNDPNVILSSSLAWAEQGDRVVNSTPGPGILNPALAITTNAVTVPGVDAFLTQWLIPQVSNQSDPQSIFSQYFSGVIGSGANNTGSFYGQSLNKTLESLALIGYRGQYYDYADASVAPWSSTPQKNDPFYEEVLKDLRDLSNYKSDQVWGHYNGAETVQSRYDLDALLQRIAALDDPSLTPDLWYPSLLYTYATEANGPSYPGPVLMIEPGDDVALRFSNQLEIPGLTEEQAQKATLIPNNTYGNSASDGLGANTSTNYHLHGSHTFPAGFGDNVVARYTTGQSWTTDLPIPFDHGQGSYWYHPHYHPSVNQQVYAGLSGFMQIGDPLSKIPPLKDVPRNLAVLKTLDVALDTEGAVELTGIANLGTVANRMTMNTVNGEFQPQANAGRGGWQAITLSNQANQAFYNIAFINHRDGKATTLPFYLYGEDGHQYPQIRPASEAGVLGQVAPSSGPVEAYAQANGNLMMLAPGKRLDVLVYLPDGITEIASLQQFEQDGLTYQLKSTGGYPDLSVANTEKDVNAPKKKKSGPGPLATFTVSGGEALPTQEWLDATVAGFNQSIQVQDILPTTRQEEYDPAAVPSVDLFAEQDGTELWTPIRNREFHWTKNVLAGPKEEYDGATQQLLAELERQGVSYDRYTTLPLPTLAQQGQSWLGYENPFLINDHVFPNGTLNVSQLGTVEEWTNWNYSIGSQSKYIAHPFHIHINDYQVKDSDESFAQKRNLEDVTPLNSSGYKYWDPNADNGQGGKGAVVELKPLKGEFLEIPEAVDPTLNPEVTKNLATYGANGQTIRMLFQDYVGAYVFHCHILPHEDAGMMLAMLVIENTRDSLLLGNELFEADLLREADGDVRITLLTGDGLEQKSLVVPLREGATPQRSDVGDLSGDFVQDVVIASSGDGMVRVFDGAALMADRTELLGEFRPYDASPLAPWVFAADVNGDNGRDITTAGFTAVGPGGGVALEDLSVSGWQTGDGGRGWSPLFSFDPFDFIDVTAGGRFAPIAGLTAADVSVSLGDHNLDNFNDIALAYRVDGGVRVVILDGAASALTLQTGTFTGGYFPNQSVLGDVLIEDAQLASSEHIALSSGYNLYAQNALENLLLTSSGPGGSSLYTLQLQAGHFIATSTRDSDVIGEGMEMAEGGHGAGIHYAGDHKLTNLAGAGFAVHLVDEHSLSSQANTPVNVTPVFAGAKANAGLLVQAAGGGELHTPQLLFPTGNQFNGQESTSAGLLDNAQQLVVDLDALHTVSASRLEGVGGLLVPTEVDEQRNLLSLLNWAYFGSSEPTPMAQWGASLASGTYAGQSIRTFTEAFTSSDWAQAKIRHHFGRSLEVKATPKIVAITYETLLGRRPSSLEEARWRAAVDTGRLTPDLLPLAILQDTVRHAGVDPLVPNGPSYADPFGPPDDQARLALLAAGAQWSDSQWANNATIDGSYGQGLTGERGQFDQLTTLLEDLRPVAGYGDAQHSFDRFVDEALVLLGGEELSNSGFF